MWPLLEFMALSFSSKSLTGAVVLYIYLRSGAIYTLSNEAATTNLTAETAAFNNISHVFLVAHGYLQNSSCVSLYDIRNGIFEQAETQRLTDDVAVILIDYGPLAGRNLHRKGVSWVVGYPFSVARLRHVITTTADALHYLQTSGYIDVERHTFVCIGISLGAHVCGGIGNMLNTRYETLDRRYDRWNRRYVKYFKRIYALDPAHPLVIGEGRNRLRYDSAGTVLTLSTDPGTYGTYKTFKSSNIHILVNGGHPQPGCINHVCSHQYAVTLFTHLIRFINQTYTEPASNFTYTFNLFEDFMAMPTSTDANAIAYGNERFLHMDLTAEVSADAFINPDPTGAIDCGAQIAFDI